MQEPVSEQVLEAMGISRPVYEEVQMIVGHLPSVDELSTLLAMWESNGRQTGLLSWLKGQPHAAPRHDYLGQTDADLREPRVRECLDIARSLFAAPAPPAPTAAPAAPPAAPPATGLELFMVGDVSTAYLDSDYARRYLHLASAPVSMGSAEADRDYRLLILQALLANRTLLSLSEVGRGGLFAALLRYAKPRGFDILACRETRLDAFLFGEEPGRFLVSLPEPEVDFFLLKLSDAGLNCCFLGRTTSGRILVDGTDFGPSSDFYA